MTSFPSNYVGCFSMTKRTPSAKFNFSSAKFNFSSAKLNFKNAKFNFRNAKSNGNSSVILLVNVRKND